MRSEAVRSDLPTALVDALPTSVETSDVAAWAHLGRALSASYGEAFIVWAPGTARPLFALERTSVTDGYKLVALDEQTEPVVDRSGWEERLVLRTAEGEERAVALGLADRDQIVTEIEALRAAMRESGGASAAPPPAGEPKGSPRLQVTSVPADLGMGDALNLGTSSVGEIGAGVELSPEDRAAAYEAALARSPGRDEAVVLYASLAEVRAALDDPAGAAEAHTELLALDPGRRDALEALAPLLEQLDDWARLTVVLEQLAEIDEEPAQRLARLKALATVYEDQLADLDAAENAWLRAAELEPDDAEVGAAMERLLSLQERWSALADWLERRLDHASSRREAEELHRRLGRLLDDRLGDTEGALAHWEALLALAPNDAEALDAVARAAGGAGADATAAGDLSAPHTVASLGEPYGEGRRDIEHDGDVEVDDWHDTWLDKDQRLPAEGGHAMRSPPAPSTQSTNVWLAIAAALLAAVMYFFFLK